MLIPNNGTKLHFILILLRKIIYNIFSTMILLIKEYLPTKFNEEVSRYPLHKLWETNTPTNLPKCTK